jgi:hypothetical protein
MDKLKQIRITVNRSEWTLIRKLQSPAQADCPQCGARVEMATPEQAVTLTGIHSRVIYGLVERERVHFIETTDGHLLICLDSLHAAFENSLKATQELVSLGNPQSLPIDADQQATVNRVIEDEP